MIMFIIVVFILQCCLVQSDRISVYMKLKTGSPLNACSPLSEYIHLYGCALACQRNKGCCGFYHKQNDSCRLCHKKQREIIDRDEWEVWELVFKIKEVKEVRTTAPTTQLPTTTSPLFSIDEECDLEGYIFLRAVHMCIRFYQTAMEWMKASIFCQTSGARLIKLDTTDKMKGIREYIQDDKGLRKTTYYIGAYRRNRDDKWKWEDGTELDTFGFKGRNRPGGNNCMNLHVGENHYWNKGACNYPQGFICERDDIV